MKIYCALLLGVIFLAGCETAKPRGGANGVSYVGVSFELYHPPPITVIDEKGDGFVVYYFRTGKSKTKLGIYEGQYPSPFARKERNLTTLQEGITSRKNIERGEDIWGVDLHGKYWRESVWNCFYTAYSTENKSYRLPIKFHIWYFEATQEEKEMFDSMIDTIEMRS